MKKFATYSLILMAYLVSAWMVSLPTMAVPNHGTVIENYAYICPIGTPPDCVYFPNGTCWVDE